MITLLLAAAIVLPTDRSYIVAETERPAEATAQCAQDFFDKGGTATIEAMPYGRRVDYRYANLGGTVRDPTMSLEVHDGVRRTLLLYGFGSWRGAAKSMWRDMAKGCFPELREAVVVKP